MSSDRLRLILIQLFRTGLWLPIIQTLLWVVHGTRDATFAEWATKEIGPVGDMTGLYVLTTLFAVMAVVPLIIALTDHRAVRALILVLSVLFFLASLGDWVGYQSPLPYQLILKGLHTPLSLLGVIMSWKWLRAP